MIPILFLRKTKTKTVGTIEPMKILFLALSFFIASDVLAQDEKAQRLDRFYKTCLQNSLSEGKDQEKICKCLRTNFERRFDAKSLATLAQAHEGKLPKDTLAENEAVLEFDLMASEKCLENSDWKWEPEKKPSATKEKKTDKKSESPKANPKK